MTSFLGRGRRPRLNRMGNFAGPRHFHVLADVASCFLNLSNKSSTTPQSVTNWSGLLYRFKNRKVSQVRGPYNKHSIYRGYYTAVRRYEFYLRVVKTIFYERAQRVSKYCFHHEISYDITRYQWKISYGLFSVSYCQLFNKLCYVIVLYSMMYNGDLS